ncbi:hypothetical protein FHR92_005095 [Fontibacillus solani]|uniref:Uncharacterized protein n=1 Tax=Fontibacillus solani TaxID=1572857 RepID=A0A7W3XUF1_9BACL|nr:hypothetical protein [Fontibacillus solani]MBA9088578.1 hypothetical protein [Fontibacillus solani]
MSDKEEKDMISNKKDVQKTTTASNAAVLNIAKMGMNNYKKTLSRLAKN